ncbi:hypothetical protein [Risungbinella massiliensis]|uniref:hypothetical protein n=1 Tax=Risungbinella massiliensis TaxID=1329796 RepID=UPI0005CC03D1|nr:hypothetical protein [Risungbinella massiliensis]
MNQDFTSYDAYLERYRLFYDEEGDERPPIMSQEEFQQRFDLLRDSYQVYQQYIDMGQVEQGSIYYQSVINGLENLLAIADGTDNFSQDIYGGAI